MAKKRKIKSDTHVNANKIIEISNNLFNVSY